MFKSIPDALTPQQAWNKLSACAPLQGEKRFLESALNHCLTSDFYAPEDVPAAHRSFMDGYAFSATDLSSGISKFRVVGEVLMGEFPGITIRRGEAVRIPTGGFLPEGADCVVMQEDVSVDGDLIAFSRPLKTLENVQVRGEDYKKGALILRSGHCLRAQDLAALATFGCAQIDVRKKPKLSVYSTGNELVSYSDPELPLGSIRESNSLALTSAAKKFGFSCERRGIIPDVLEDQRQAMKEALDTSDVVLVSGGSSVGEKDFTLPVIESFDSHKIHFHGLAIRPGNPTIFASIGKKFVFGLPGQPVSSLIVFYQFVLPFLFHLAGEIVNYSSFHNTRFPARQIQLSRSVQPLKSKTDYLRLRILDNGTAEPVPGKSASLFTLTQADGYTVIEPGEHLVPEGTLLLAILFP